MVYKERELKLALINKEEIEDKLAKLEGMLPQKYLSDEIHESLRCEYATIKERSDYLLTNLEELNTERRITNDKYILLKNEYTLINESSGRLLANKSAGSISIELYNQTKKEYSEKLNQSFLAIGGIQSEIRKSIGTEEAEIKRFNSDIERNNLRYKTGEIKQFDYDRQRISYEKKIESSQKTVSELKKLVAVESSKDIAMMVKKQGSTSGISIPSSISESMSSKMPVSMPSSLSGLTDKLPQSVDASGFIGKIKGFVSRLKDRYWGLSSTYKIVVGFLTWTFGLLIYGLLVSPIYLWAFYLSMTGHFIIGILIILLLGIIGVIGILVPGLLMFIYGVRDAWREKSA